MDATMDQSDDLEVSRAQKIEEHRREEVASVTFRQPASGSHYGNTSHGRSGRGISVSASDIRSTYIFNARTHSVIVKYGLQKAKAAGVKLGRPAVRVDKGQVMAMRNEGKSWRAIARILGCAVGTAYAKLNGQRSA